MRNSGDALADFERYEDEREERLKMLPICECCNNPIQQEKAIYYNDQWCCEECEEIFWMNIREDFLERVDVDG